MNQIDRLIKVCEEGSTLSSYSQYPDEPEFRIDVMSDQGVIEVYPFGDPTLCIEMTYYDAMRFVTGLVRVANHAKLARETQ